MKTIVLKNTSGTLFVEVKVDLMESSENFTIMAIEQRSNEEVVAGISLQELPSSITEMKAFAIAKNVLMDIIDIDPAVATKNIVTSVVALSMTSTGAMTGGNQAVGYSKPVIVAGGNGPLTYTLTAGVLPTGLILDKNTGYINGIPTVIENQTFTVTAVDAFGQSDSDATLSINIAA